jgi:ribosomal protein L7/L12
MTLTLKEAEAILSKLFDGISVRVESTMVAPDDVEHIMAIIGHRNKIFAIKHYRSIFPTYGLAEAKEAVERAMQKYPAPIAGTMITSP